MGSKTYGGCMQRAAGDVVFLAGTGIAYPEPQVCTELRRVGEP